MREHSFVRHLFVGLLLMNTTVAEAQSTTRFVNSTDGTRIAYDVTGTGPALMLLHGGGQTRRSWHEQGYVRRLASEFTVITVDFRGNGASDKPAKPEAYALDKLTADLLAVADAAGARRFAVMGFSYGANIGRYLVTRSDRVSAMVYIGIPFGPAAAGIFRQTILDMRAKWAPAIAAHERGALDVATLSEQDRAAWQRANVPVTVAWLSAMLDYPAVEPSDMKVPTLWLVGTANAGTMESVEAYRSKLAGTRVTLVLVPGFNHQQEQERIDDVLPKELEFLRAQR